MLGQSCSKMLYRQFWTFKKVQQQQAVLWCRKQTFCSPSTNEEVQAEVEDTNHQIENQHISSTPQSNQSVEPCVEYSQIEDWSQRFECQISSQMALKWTLFDQEVGVIMGPNGTFLQDLQQRNGVKIFVSEQGDFYPGVRKRVASVVGSGSGLFPALSELFPALQKYQSSSPVVKRIINNNPRLDQTASNFQLSSFFPEEVVKQLNGGMHALTRQQIEEECDIVCYTEKQNQRLPGVSTLKVDFLGQCGNVLKAVVMVLGHAQKYEKEVYRKFVNQSLYRHTEQSWFGVLNRSLPKDSSLRKGQYKVEFTVADQLLELITPDNLKNFQKVSKASIQIEDIEEHPQSKKVILSGLYLEVMRGQVMMVIQMLNKTIQRQQQEKYKPILPKDRDLLDQQNSHQQVQQEAT
eukprot:TRINITY_DN22544_c0_g2_i1.p1 TRINITY_DN22544_c0_g2~~TRINITY_DN22544_c0_g2_i1.p1  ORF type:complete len:407 (-),score=35.37 TRINITY_DN22544_c0_g2_i1:104-1324(-)